MQEAAGSSQPIMADGSVKKCLRSNGEMVHDHEQEDRKKRDMFVEEMEQAHADELTAQAEEIVNLQDEIKETGAALEAKDSEVVQLRFQLIMLEKIYREKKEEQSRHGKTYHESFQIWSLLKFTGSHSISKVAVWLMFGLDWGVLCATGCCLADEGQTTVCPENPRFIFQRSSQLQKIVKGHIHKVVTELCERQPTQQCCRTACG